MKRPRTPHLEGSGLEPGAPDRVPFRDLSDLHWVVEEKLDGQDVGVHFPHGPSRPQILVRGAPDGDSSETSLFRSWIMVHQRSLWERLGSRYIVYWESVFAKHTIFYDQLPHYFLESGIYDRETQTWLSTPARGRLLAGLDLPSVPVLHAGPVESLNQVAQWVGPSSFISEHASDRLRELAAQAGLSWEKMQEQSDLTGLMEGLYINLEEGDRVIRSVKYVRKEFIEAILRAKSHWRDRRLIQNSLASEGALF